jgi:hypothetical protein
MATYTADADVLGFDNKNPAKAMPAIGSYTPLVPFVVSGAGASTGNDSISITFPSLREIVGWVCDVYLLADGSKASDDAILVTKSGNTLTITEAAGGVIEVNRYQGFAWGPIR